MMAGIIFLPVCSWADPDYQTGSDYHPSNSWGNFGLGVEVGDPGSWGISGKFWLDRANAFQPAVKFGNSNAILQLDYLWHNFAINEKMPIYIGVGGNLLLQSTVVFAGRVPGGYLFAGGADSLVFQRRPHDVQCLWRNGSPYLLLIPGVKTQGQITNGEKKRFLYFARKLF